MLKPPTLLSQIGPEISALSIKLESIYGICRTHCSAFELRSFLANFPTQFEILHLC